MESSSIDFEIIILIINIIHNLLIIIIIIICIFIIIIVTIIAINKLQHKNVHQFDGIAFDVVCAKYSPRTATITSKWPIDCHNVFDFLTSAKIFCRYSYE
ncbi:hypothetical protein QR98_0073400 [Sarcoptes scabiei]|uniref:Uncharacterized protein n=1 Tax=Sarcoptes scabiei TaxID=52283 RepID=A0A132AE31_SARSC|nr:hypothetical protein QR98_0073400 [Sarcoptes scabiei]